MVIFPNAKINIGLNILRKREDGYHEIETLFYPIGLKDALEYVANGKDQLNFESSGLALDIRPEENIVSKAYRMLQEEFSLPGMDIHLHKVIPSGAGLGGGSADAAFFLKSVNEHFELKISAGKLKSMAGRLGADCAFFLENKPAYATGTGDQLSTFDVSLKGFHLLLVKPPFAIDTKAAYAGVHPRVFPLDFKRLINTGISEWRNFVKNDFEQSLFLKFPELSHLHKRLSGMGALYVSMSGSGSSVYGIFEKEQIIGKNDFPSDFFIWQEPFN
jgi:4-diphosphocytidyl-2-C-methyl-D-erythritol kinase